jgi:2-octaprenyl-6-methoxyphenol hydroxylase
MERGDVLILGGGLVGLTLAVALERHGVTSIVVDAAEPSSQIAPAFDGRANAVSSSSWRLLEAIGVGAHLDGFGCPIRSIRVSDGLRPGALTFDPDRGEDHGRAARHHVREPAAAGRRCSAARPTRRA